MVPWAYQKKLAGYTPDVCRSVSLLVGRGKGGGNVYLYIGKRLEIRKDETFLCIWVQG